jgi:hypothetical protein
MSSLRTFSSAVAAANESESSWTHVTGGRRSAPAPAPAPSSSGWGTPTTTAARKPFSFASTETAAALDTTATKKPTGNWASSRPGGAIASAKAAIPRPLDIASMSDFPTLGSASSAPVARATAPTTTWSSLAATRPVEEVTTAATATAGPTDEIDATLSFLRNRRKAPTHSATAAPSRTSRLAAIGTRCFDDGPTDYDGPEEDDDGAGSYHVPEEGESTGELNADLAVTRRAGDKSDW